MIAVAVAGNRPLDFGFEILGIDRDFPRVMETRHSFHCGMQVAERSPTRVREQCVLHALQNY